MAMELDAAGRGTVAGISSDAPVTLVAEANGAAGGNTPATITIALDAGNATVHLPAGTDTSHPVQVGNDLEFIQPDGSIILIPGGAVTGLVIFVGNVEIPADAVAALFSANNIQPAEGPQGPPQGAHGNFTHEPGGIGNAFGLTDLLGPNELHFGTNPLPELFGAVNAPPRFVDGSGADISTFAMDNVTEEALTLPPGNPDTLGNPDTSSLRQTTGTFFVIDPNNDPLTFTIDPPPGTLLSGGDPILWSHSGSNVLIGALGDGTEILRVTLIDGAVGDGKGIYTVTLSGPIDHPFHGTGAADEDVVTLQFPVTVSDGQGGSDTATFTVGIEDDSPELKITLGEVGARGLTLNLDETVQPDGGSNAAYDRYNSGESESAPGASNGGVDDVGGPATYNRTPVLSTNPSAASAIGHLATASGAFAGTFGESASYGADGQGAAPIYAFGLSLSADGLATNLTATGATILPGLTLLQRAISLYAVSDTVIEGRIAGSDPSHQYVAFRITIENPSDPATAHLVVDQFLPIDHGGSESPSVLDEVMSLLTPTGSLSLSETVTITDGDGDTKTDTASATLIGGQSSVISFDDDGPRVSVSAAEGFSLVHDETLLVQSGDDDILFTSVFNGVANPGVDNDVPFNPGLHLPIGYARSQGSALAINTLDYGTDGAATSGAKVYSLTLTDANGAVVNSLASGLTTTEGKEIMLFIENGMIVGRYDGADAGADVTGPTDPAAFAIAINSSTGVVSLVQYVSLHHNSPDLGQDSDEAVSLSLPTGALNATLSVTDGDGDVVSASATIGGSIQFEDDGPLILTAKVDRNFGLVVDETDGTQAGTDDVGGPLAVFATVPAVGVDPDGSAPLAYAVDHHQAISFVPFFGVDGRAATGAVAFSLALGSDHDSGLNVTDGSPILLSLESDGTNHWIVGRVDGGTFDGKAAFALAIDPSTGEVSLVQYLSLEHVAGDPNDPIALASGAVQAVVTITDGDGDTASKGVDISGSVVFRDDGPTMADRSALTAEVDEDGLHQPLTSSLSDSNTDDGRDGEVTGTNSSIVTDADVVGTLKSLVDFGADGFGSFGLKTQATGVDSGVESKGDEVLIVTSGSMLYGYVGAAAGYNAGTDRLVFQLTLGADGSFTFQLFDQIDHPSLDSTPNSETPGEYNDAENMLSSGIDLSSFILATDGDGDSIPLGAGAFTVQVRDDIPVLTARAGDGGSQTETENIDYSWGGGGHKTTDVADGANDRDIRLTATSGGSAAFVNTSSSTIGVDDADIDGYDKPKNKPATGPEILNMDFVNSLVVDNQGNVSSSGSPYDVNAVTFAINVGEAHKGETAVVYIAALDAGSNPVALTFATTPASTFTVTPVLSGTATIGYVLDGVPDGATVSVAGATQFDHLEVGNYNGFEFLTTGGLTTLSDGNPFKIADIATSITTTVQTPETFAVAIDETDGVNTAADPNPANDVSGAGAPAAVLLAGHTPIGYAESSTSVLDPGSLFSGRVGADEYPDGAGRYSFAITDKDGNPASGPSGLLTLAGTSITLSTDANGALVGAAGNDVIFKVAVDDAGHLWIAQYQPIANDLAGSGLSAADDIARITAELHIKATLTDFDGDSVTQLSPIPLQIEFQDDGPKANDDTAPTSVGGAQVIVDVAANDLPGTDGVNWSDVSGTAVSNTDPAHGAVVYNGNGTFTYTPTAGYEGDDSFTYTITDGDGDTSTATVQLSTDAVVGTPTVQVDLDEEANALVVKEDNSATVTFTAAVAAGSDDVLTQVEITGLESGITYAINGDAPFVADGNPVTIALPAHPITASFAIAVYPPEDSDADLGTITVTATAADGNNLGVTTTNAASANVVVDAVLDQYADVAQSPSAAANESTASQFISLNLTLALHNTTAGSPTAAFNPPSNEPRDTTQEDTDGSETIAVKIAVTGGVVALQLDATFAAANPSVSLAQGPAGTWTLSGATTLNLADAVAAVGAIVPANFDGSILGTITAVSTDTAPGGIEVSTADNAVTDNANWSLAVTPQVGTPTVSADFDAETNPLVVKEDNSASVTFSASVATGTDDVLASAQINGLDASATYIINGGAPITGVTSTNVTFGPGTVSTNVVIEVIPTEDSDVDLGTITVVVTAADGNNSGITTTNSASAAVVVDAVLDEYADVGQSAAGAATEAIATQNVALHLTLSLVDTSYASPSNEPNDTTQADTDGSETIAVTITVGSAANTAGVDLTLVSPPAGASLTETVAGSGIWTLTVASPADLATAVAAVQAVVPANYDGTVSGTIQAVSTDNSTDSEPDLTDNSETHSASWSLSIAAQAAAPTVTSDAEGGQLVIKEDGSGTVTFSLGVASGTDDVLTQAVVSGLHNGISYTISGYNSGNPFVSNGLDVTVSFAAHTTNTTVAVTATPPADSDVDLGTVTVTATAADGDDASATNTSSASASIIVDAILDDAVSLATTPQTTSESTTAIALSLGLDGTAFNPFTGSGNGGPDTDGSESGTFTLTLSSALPAGVTLGFAATYVGTAVLTPQDATTFTITGLSATDLAAAIDALVANVPAGYDGTIAGSVQVSFTEANTPVGTVPASGAEPDVTDNTSTASKDFSLTVNAVVATPTISSDLVGQSLLVKEDNSAIVTLTATAGATDVITSVTVTGLTTGATYIINSTTVPGSAGSYTVTFPGTHISESVVISVSPTQDSDVDLTTLSAVATAKDADHTASGDPGHDSAPVTVPIVVDAILDQYVDASAAPVSGSSTANAQTLSLGVGASVATAPFTGSGNGGADTDGSESTTATIALSAALPLGGSLSLASGAAISLQAGVDSQHFTLTGTATQVQLALTLLQVTVPAAYSGTISGTVSTTSSEAIAPASGSEPVTTDNSYTDATAANFSVVITNSTPQVVDDTSSLTVKEAALDTIPDPNDLAPGVKTGTNPISPDETAIDANTIGFKAVGENITSIKFADPNSTTDTFADPAFTHLGAGQGTPTWTLSGDGRTLTLSYAGQTALILHLTGATTINAGVTDTVSVTATLVDHVFHDASALDVVLSGIKVVATDQSGDQVAGSVTVNIVDDTPIAHADSNSVVEGAAIGGNVLTGVGADVFGVDGPTSTTPVGGVVGVRAVAGDTTTDVITGVDTDITGLHGTLHLKADGSYTYSTLPNSISADTTDVFVYTIKDGDGDLSTTTLTIDLAAVTITAPTNTDVTVDEKALDTSATGSDIAFGTVVGSLPGSPLETDNSNQLAATGNGVGTLHYELVSGANAVTAGSYGSIQVNANGSYVYTLTKNYLNSTANDGVQTLSGLESFSYKVTDANGNTAFGTIHVSIVDDVPTATAATPLTVQETDGITSGGSLLANGSVGADGGSITAISFDGTTWIPVGPGATPISGTQGSYVISPNGSWTFDPIVNASTSAQDGSFHFRVTDGDGDTSEALQTVTINNTNVPINVSGSVTGLVEEEQLTPGNQAGYPVTARGNEDTNDAAGLDTDETATQVTNVQTGTFGVTITGSEGTPSFSFGPVTDITAVTKVGGGTLTSGGATIRYHLVDATHLVGYADVGADGNGYASGDRVIFAIQITDQATGAYTFTLLDHIDHPTAASGSANEENISINLGGRVTVSDTGQPGDSTTIANFSMTVIDDTPTFTQIMNAIVGNASNNTASGMHNLSLGADGLGSINISALTSISGVTYLPVTHLADGSAKLTAQVSGSDFFTVTIKPDGTYDFTLVNSRAAQSQSFDFANVSGGQAAVQFTIGDATFTAVDTNHNNGIDNGEELKPSSQGFGVGNGNLDSGEQFRVTFPSAIDSVNFQVNMGNGQHLAASWITNTGETGSFNATSPGLQTVNPAQDFTWIQFTVTDGSAKLDNFGYSKLIIPADLSLSFDVYGTDADGDPSAHQTLGVTLLGSTTSTTITGTGASETIVGTSAANTISGGAGNDILAGGTGTDTFKWGAETLSTANADIIRDYTNNERLDVSTLLGNVPLGGFAKVLISGSDLLVRLDTNGGGDSYVTAFTLKGAAATVTSVNLYYNGVDHTIASGSFISGADPIVLDLDHNGYTFSSVQNGVSFDINADGHADKVAWNTSGDGLLAIDLNHDGKIDDGKELFTPDFNGGHFASGSAALASLDTNDDGMIDSKDVDFSNLVLWKDANADGVTDSGELTTLTQNGIASITAPATPVDDIAGGQTVTAEGTVTYTDGSTGGYVEVALDARLGSDTPLLAGDNSTDGLDWDSIVVGTPDAVDTLHGTAGADKFVLTDTNAVDFIADYNFEQGDTVDLSALFGHNSGATADNAGDYVRLEGNTLQVDVDGAGTAHEFIDVSVLNQPVADVKVILDDGVDATVNHIG